MDISDSFSLFVIINAGVLKETKNLNVIFDSIISGGKK